MFSRIDICNFIMFWVWMIFIEKFSITNSLIEISDGCYWKHVKVNKSILENEVTVQEISLHFEILCPLYARSPDETNTFCFQNGVCHLFKLQPCQVSSSALNDEDYLDCYFSTDFEKIKNMPSEATFYKLAGCVWLSEFGSSFTEINENCKEGGGQLITFEHFQNETDSLNLVTSIGYNDKLYVGAIRQGFANKFKWLTGSILENTSFLWNENEPQDYVNEISCVQLHGITGKLDDVRCNNYRKGVCHIYIL
ncbi:UNVERIFIED_CONTAM: hypothetical protein RMT77_006268 [Armadillidium vulgare]